METERRSALVLDDFFRDLNLFHILAHKASVHNKKNTNDTKN